MSLLQDADLLNVLAGRRACYALYVVVYVCAGNPTWFVAPVRLQSS